MNIILVIISIIFLLLNGATAYQYIGGNVFIFYLSLYNMAIISFLGISYIRTSDKKIRLWELE